MKNSAFTQQLHHHLPPATAQEYRERVNRFDQATAALCDKKLKLQLQHPGTPVIDEDGNLAWYQNPDIQTVLDLIDRKLNDAWQRIVERGEI